MYMSNTRGQQLGRDAEPRVLDAEHGIAAVGAERHADLAAGRRVLDRVGHDVDQHLLQPHRIRIDPHRLGADADLDYPIQPGIVDERGGGSAYRLRHVERLSIEPDLSGDHALNVKQVVDQM
jgi:hypothetical protein